MTKQPRSPVSRRMVRLFRGMVLAAWGSWSAMAAQAQPAQVIYGQELIDYGVMRPADLVRLLPDWSSYSIDGFTRRVSPGGLGDYSSQRWLLLVNGRPVETSALEILNLNLLPVNVADIDSVVVTSQPSMAGGFFADRGSIQIFTKTLRHGLDAGGSLYTGNEVNDPGPFIYTPDATPNIDRIGPDFSAYGQAAYNGFFAAATSLYREHHATDQHIGFRTRHLHDNSNHSPRLILWAHEARMGHRNTAGSTDISVSRSIFDDFPFIQRYGAEVPLRQTYTSISGNADYALGNGISVAASATMTEDHSYRRDNFLDWDPAIKLDYLRSRAQIRYTAGGWRLYGGGGYDRFGARPYFYGLSSDHYTLVRAQAGIIRTVDIHRFSADLEMTRVSDQLLPKVVARYQTRTDQGLHFHLSASYSSHSILEENNVLYWMGQGYGGFQRLGPDPAGFEAVAASRQTTVDAGLDWEVLPRFTISAGGGVRAQGQQWALLKTFEFVPEDNRYAGEERLVPDLGGVRGIASLGLDHELGTIFDQSLQYHYNGELSGGRPFREQNRTTPRHTLLYRLRYRPVSSFSLSGRLRVHSPTEWSSFYGTTAPYLGGPVVPTQIHTGIFIRKTAFDGRVFVALGIDNVLNRALQQWPGGEVRDMIFEIQAGVRLRGRNPVLQSSLEMERPFY